MSGFVGMVGGRLLFPVSPVMVPGSDSLLDWSQSYPRIF